MLSSVTSCVKRGGLKNGKLIKIISSYQNLRSGCSEFAAKCIEIGHREKVLLSSIPKDDPYIATIWSAASFLHKIQLDR